MCWDSDRAQCIWLNQADCYSSSTSEHTSFVGWHVYSWRRPRDRVHMLTLLLLLSCPACYALSLARSRPIRCMNAMVSAGSTLISSLWDRNGFPKVSCRSCLHAGHFPRRCSLSSSSMLHVSHVPSSSRPILFLWALSSTRCPVLICASVVLSCLVNCPSVDLLMYVPLGMIHTLPPTFVQFPLMPWLDRFIVHCCSCLLLVSSFPCHFARVSTFSFPSIPSCPGMHDVHTVALLSPICFRNFHASSNGRMLMCMMTTSCQRSNS